MTDWDKELGITPSDISGEVTIPSNPDMELREQSYNAQQTIELAKNDMNFLAGLVMPTVFKYLFPIVFKAVWSWIVQWLHKDRVFPQLALGLPRGFGKTTVMKLLIVYIILFTKKRFILIFCGTQPKAVNIIDDVMKMLSHPNIVRLFGDWTLGADKDRQELKKFGFRGRTIIILGMGTGGDIRGYNLDNARPDFMLFDDIQSKEDAESDILSAHIEDWFQGTALKAKAPDGCVFLFVGNMYPTKNSLLRKLKHNHTWIKFITGAILEDGTSLWEELQPLNQLLDEFERDLAAGKPEIFYSEVMNDENANMNNAIDLSKVEIKSYDGELSSGSFVIVDPSNDKANSDDVAIAGFQVIDGFPVMFEVISDKLSPGDIIRESIKMAIRQRSGVIFIEGVAFQYSLLYWFEQIKLQLGLTGIECIDIYPGGLSKNTRILSMFKQLVAGEVQLHPDVRVKVFHEVAQWKPLLRNNKDNILDCLTYAPKIMTEHAQHIVYQNPIDQQIGSAESSSYLYDEIHNSPF